MSDLRDITMAMRATSKRLNSFGEALIILLRDSAQQTEWRHQQKNDAVIRAAQHQLILDQLETMRVNQRQLEEFSAKLWDYLGRLDEREELGRRTRHDDLKEMKSRLHALESDHPQDEVTKV